MALIRSSFPTISTRKACRPGMSNAFTTPSRAARTNISGTVIRWTSVRPARMHARIIDAVWVAITTRWRLYRSATIPPRGENKKTGNWLANPTDPSRSEDPVRRYTSHACATFCIQVPTRDMSCPPEKSWKFRCLRARRVTGKPRELDFAAVGALDCEESEFGTELTFHDAVLCHCDANRSIMVCELLFLLPRKAGLR